MPPPGENAYNLVVCPPKTTKLKTSNPPRDAYKIWQFRKNCANKWLLRGKIMAKIRNFVDSFGAVFPHFCPDKREIWHGGCPLPVPNFTFIGATCRPCGAKNLFLDHWVKQYRHGCATRRPASNYQFLRFWWLQVHIFKATAAKIWREGANLGDPPHDKLCRNCLRGYTHFGQIYTQNYQFRRFWGLQAHILRVTTVKFGATVRTWDTLPRP